MPVNLDIAQGAESKRFICTTQRPPRLIVIFTLLFMLLSIAAAAQPLVNNLQLSKSSAEFTTLTGSGFGSFEGQVLSWDSFESPPTALPQQDIPATAGHNWLSGGDAAVAINKQFAMSGSQSIGLEWSQGKTGYLGWTGKGPYKRLYISYWRRMDGNLTQGGSHRQFLITGKATNKPPILSLAIEANTCWTLSSNLAGSAEIPIHLPDNNDCWGRTTGKFQRWEFWIDLTQNSINAWLDNTSIIQSKAPKLTDGFTGVSVGYDASGLEQARTWLDDIYIANTQARVEACNAPEYNQCTRRILQYVAPDNWSHNEIKFRLHNLRALRGEAIYLYVVDAEGQVSNGIAIARPVIKAN